MHHFNYKDGELYCEDVPLRSIAEKAGTPCYVYSRATLERHFLAFDRAFNGIEHLTCFSVKALSNVAVLRLFANFGSGFDIVSGGELFRVEKAGGEMGKVVFSGVSKSEWELRYALEKGILLFNVESESELKLLNKIAGDMGKKARVALRINPDIDPQTHPHISTGLKTSKFGIGLEKARELFRGWKEYPHIEFCGVDCHIGSQLLKLAPIVEALSHLVQLVVELRGLGLDIKYLDLGGGLGIAYNDEEPPPPMEYAREVSAAAREVNCKLILEPGRVIVGNAGILLLRVVYLKETGAKKFVIVDGGMNDLIRPALYGAYHEVLPVIEKPVRSGNIVDLVGPICETTDFLAKNRVFPDVKPGELLAVMSAGAYGFVMASNYNSHPLPAEVLVSGKDFYVVRERERLEDLTGKERIPEILLQR